MAILTFDQVPAALIGAEGQGGRLMSRVLDLACVALGAEQAGGARRCLEMSAGYARTRFQFGRAIGSFQAVKHKCADMLVRVELAEATAREAAGWRMRPRRSSRSPPRRRTSAARRRTCSLRQYFRRAKSSRLLFGDPAVYHERSLDRLSI
jgi:alkylation response protein AidB-like acyl-CoA dehydrogenase